MRETLSEWSLGDVTLRGYDSGDSTSRVVLLLHGFPEFHFTWRYQIEPLRAAGYRVIAPDLRGYNRSDKPAGASHYAISRVAGDIVRLIEQLGVHVDLVGHDWGGVTAWRVAHEIPQHLRRLVIVNIPHPLALKRHARSPQQFVRFWYQFALQPPVLPEAALRMRNFALLRRVLQRAVRHPEVVSREALARYVDAWSQPGALTAMVNYYRALFRKSPSSHARATTPQEPPPTMLIWGEHEPVFLEKTILASRDFVPSIRIERVADGGHFVHQDRPDEVNRLVMDFLLQ